MHALVLMVVLLQPAQTEEAQAAPGWDFTPPFLGTTPAHHQADAIMLISLGTVWTGGGILAWGSATVATVALGGGMLLVAAVSAVTLGGQYEAFAVTLGGGLLATVGAGFFQFGLAAALIAAGAAALIVGRNMYVRGGALTAAVEGQHTSSATEPSANPRHAPLSERERALFERVREVLAERGYQVKEPPGGRRLWTVPVAEQLEGGIYRHSMEVAPGGFDGIQVTADCEKSVGEGEEQRWKPCPRDDPVRGQLTEKAKKMGLEARKRAAE